MTIESDEVVRWAGDGSVRVRVKVVPNASRSRVAGRLGGRLKLTVAAPAESGKANAAVCALLASALGVRKQDVTVEAGHTRPEKTLRVAGIEPRRVGEALAAFL